MLDKLPVRSREKIKEVIGGVAYDKYFAPEAVETEEPIDKQKKKIPDGKELVQKSSHSSIENLDTNSTSHFDENVKPNVPPLPKGNLNIKPGDEPKTKTDIDGTINAIDEDYLNSLVRRSNALNRVLGPKPGEYESRQWFALAQFGLNLASTAGGNIAESIAKSAKNPLREFGLIGAEALKEKRKITEKAVDQLFAIDLAKAKAGWKDTRGSQEKWITYAMKPQKEGGLGLSRADALAYLPHTTDPLMAAVEKFMQQKKGRADQQEIFDFIDDYTAAKEYQLKKKDRTGITTTDKKGTEEGTIKIKTNLDLSDVKHESFDDFAKIYGGAKGTGTKLGELKSIPAGEKIYIPKNNRLGWPPGIYKWNVGQGKFNPHTLE